MFTPCINCTFVGHKWFLSNMSLSYKAVEFREKYLVYQTHHGFLALNCIGFLNLQLPRQKNRGSLCCSLLHSQDWNSQSLGCYSSIVITLHKCIFSICVWKKTGTLTVFLPAGHLSVHSVNNYWHGRWRQRRPGSTKGSRQLWIISEDDLVFFIILYFQMVKNMLFFIFFHTLKFLISFSM